VLNICGLSCLKKKLNFKVKLNKGGAKMFKFLKKKEAKEWTLFGRKMKIDEESTCDVCGKKVNMGDYAFLCRDCRDKLPLIIRQSHHILVPFPAARREYLKHFADKKDSIEEHLKSLSKISKKHDVEVECAKEYKVEENN
jgi:hypothetical protein